MSGSQIVEELAQLVLELDVQPFVSEKTQLLRERRREIYELVLTANGDTHMGQVRIRFAARAARDRPRKQPDCDSDLAAQRLIPLGRMKVREIIQRLKNEGKTVFFSSHELGEVETVCDRVAIIHQGELKVEGRVADLIQEHETNLEQIFLKIIGYQKAV